jgi:hypothetical protein
VPRLRENAALPALQQMEVVPQVLGGCDGGTMRNQWEPWKKPRPLEAIHGEFTKITWR